MALRYCKHCGEAFLISEVECAQCSSQQFSRRNRGVKTAFLLGILSIAIPSEGGAEPEDDQAVQKQPNEVLGSFSISFPGTEVPNEQAVRSIVQQHLSTVCDLQRQYLTVEDHSPEANTFSIQLTIWMEWSPNRNGGRSSIQ